MTKSESLIQAVITGLSGTSDVDDRIFRSRVAALIADEHPALIVEPVLSSPVRNAIGRLEWNTIFQVIIMIRADVPDETGDDILADVHSKVMTTLYATSGVVDAMPVSTTWDFQKADKPLGIITSQYRISYQTSETDLS